MRERLAPMRGTDGDLFATRKGAREDEVGDICAGDQKHESHSPKHHEQSGTNLADCLFAQGVNECAPALIVFRVSLGKTL